MEELWEDEDTRKRKRKLVFLSGTRELYNRTEGNLVNESARIECSTGVCLEM